MKIHSTALYVPKENNKSIFCTLKTDSNDHLCPDHPNSPVLWSGCGSAVPTTPLLSMANIVTLEFASNQDTSGPGFRLVAEEVTAGCGGILHGMVSHLGEG